MILGILSSKFSLRLGLPVLVLFLGLGMVAGAEGLGGLSFNNYSLAHAIGTVALAVILFDGGLRTPRSNLVVAWKPAALLATAGVLLTSVVTGLVGTWALGLSPLEGLLLGCIVGSTDAAAVFSVLRAAGISLRARLAAILEVESGANDPMAIFLTVGLLEVLTGRAELGWELLTLFLLQMGVGLAVGLGMARLAVLGINRINLEAPGLYPVLTTACGLLTFGLAAVLGGSGFLAIYVAGLVLGNSKLVFQRGTLLFHDALAWAGQITMFVVLGLLSNPGSLLAVAGPSLLVAAGLILVARPVAVLPMLLPFGFSRRELVLISWVGLKGAVPIILGIYPLIFGLEKGYLLFNVVFFVVLVSAVVQGGSLPWMARALRLEEPARAAPPFSLEITSLIDLNASIVDYPVTEGSRAAGKRLRDLALPESTVVALISRDNQPVPPRGSTRILPGDHVFIVADHASRGAVDRVFAREPGQEQAPLGMELPLPGHATAGHLASLYDIHTGLQDDVTLEELIRAHEPDATEDTVISITQTVRLRVREIQDGRIVWVGLALVDEEEREEEHPSAGDASTAS